MKVKLIVPNIHDCFFNQSPVPEGRLAVMQDLNFVPHFVFTFLCIA